MTDGVSVEPLNNEELTVAMGKLVAELVAVRQIATDVHGNMGAGIQVINNHGGLIKVLGDRIKALEDKNVVLESRMQVMSSHIKGENSDKT